MKALDRSAFRWSKKERRGSYRLGFLVERQLVESDRRPSGTPLAHFSLAMTRIVRQFDFELSK